VLPLKRNNRCFNKQLLALIATTATAPARAFVPAEYLAASEFLAASDEFSCDFRCLAPAEDRALLEARVRCLEQLLAAQTSPGGGYRKGWAVVAETAGCMLRSCVSFTAAACERVRGEGLELSCTIYCKRTCHLSEQLEGNQTLSGQHGCMVQRVSEQFGILCVHSIVGKKEGKIRCEGALSVALSGSMSL
jgi:hypothetical protein